MVGAARDLSVYRQQKRQRRERLAGAVGLIAAAMAFATALVLLTGPLPLALGFAALLGVTVIAQNPRIGLYLLLFNAILLEQWGIVGLDPVTKWFPFYETLSGAYGAGVPVSPVEMVLLVTLAAVVLPRLIRRDGAFERGPLFLPLALFLAFVVGSIAYGVAAPGGAGPFYLNAAWAETRSFFYLGVTYVLAVNLIRTQAQLRTFVWLFIVAVGIKSVQGIVRYVYARGNGLRLESIVGHEDVVFFAALVLLLGALLFFGKGFAAVTRRQMWVMAAAVPPLVFTLLVTRRRLGFIVLGVALILMGLVLLRTRRDIFMRLVPVAVLVVVVYTIVFWNNTGALGEPIRAFRSIATPTTERDMLSNAWRDLENLNIAYNIAGSPVTGLGFGRPYAFIVTQPPLDATGFTYWRYIAHNAIYWVWMKMGLLGFMLFWNVIGSAVVLGLVTFRRLRDGYLRSLALLVAGVALMQVFFSYGDLGLTYSRSMIFLGCMLGMLAVLPRLAEEALEAPPEPDVAANTEGRRVRRHRATAPARGLPG